VAGHDGRRGKPSCGMARRKGHAVAFVRTLSPHGVLERLNPELRHDLASDQIGADHMLIGSDFPHGEGLARPIEVLDDLDGFGKDDVRLVMRENGFGLTRPRPV